MSHVEAIPAPELCVQQPVLLRRSRKNPTIADCARSVRAVGRVLLPDAAHEVHASLHEPPWHPSRGLCVAHIQSLPRPQHVSVTNAAILRSKLELPLELSPSASTFWDVLAGRLHLRVPRFRNERLSAADCSIARHHVGRRCRVRLRCPPPLPRCTSLLSKRARSDSLPAALPALALFDAAMLRGAWRSGLLSATARGVALKLLLDPVPSRARTLSGHRSAR